MKLALFFILYFTTCMVATPGTEGLEFSLNGNHDADDYQVDRAEAYRSFIGSIRELLLGPDPCRVYGFPFPVLRAASTLQNQQRFLQVELVNYALDRVTVIIDISNVYVVGFIVDNVHRHFGGPLETEYVALFPGSLPMSYPGSYVSLEAQSSIVRVELDLGLGPLNIVIA